MRLGILVQSASACGERDAERCFAMKSCGDAADSVADCVAAFLGEFELRKAFGFFACGWRVMRFDAFATHCSSASRKEGVGACGSGFGEGGALRRAALALGRRGVGACGSGFAKRGRRDVRSSYFGKEGRRGVRLWLWEGNWPIVSQNASFPNVCRWIGGLRAPFLGRLRHDEKIMPGESVVASGSVGIR